MIYGPVIWSYGMNENYGTELLFMFFMDQYGPGYRIF